MQLPQDLSGHAVVYRDSDGTHLARVISDGTSSQPVEGRRERLIFVDHAAKPYGLRIYPAQIVEVRS